MDNKTMMQFFEWNLPGDGLLWRRAAAQAQALKASGIDVVWLPPAYKGAVGASDVGYSVYDLYDLGEFDQKGSIATKYGTRAEYLAAIKALQKAGVGVLADIVMDHRMGADETEKVEAEKYDPDNRCKRISGETTIEAWTKYTFPGRNGKYSKFLWNWTCFSGIDWDAGTRQAGVYQFEGKTWSNEVDTERGNFDYLMGANVDVQADYVAEELQHWGKWYVQTTGVDGLRLDALKHIDRTFYQNWLAAMRQEFGCSLYAVGEYWSGDVNDLVTYLAEMQQEMSLFDVPLHMQFHKASQGGSKFGMQGLLADTLVQKDAAHAVTFVDNHDTQPGQALESWVEEWFKPLAYAIILLRQDGLPCVYYADYYGLLSSGTPAVPGLKRMLWARRHCAYGPQHDYFDHDNVVGWTREGDAQHKNSGCAVLMSDGDGGEKSMYMGKQFAQKPFYDVMNRDLAPVTVGDDGNATFRVPGGGMSLWLPREAYERAVVHIE